MDQETRMAINNAETLCRRNTSDTRIVMIIVVLVLAAMLVFIFCMVVSESGRTSKLEARVDSLEVHKVDVPKYEEITLPYSCPDAEAHMDAQEKVIKDQQATINSLMKKLRDRNEN